jgi:hypothetical protein
MSGSPASTLPVLQQTIGTLSLIETSVPARAYVNPNLARWRLAQRRMLSFDPAGLVGGRTTQRCGRANRPSARLFRPRSVGPVR